MEERLQKILSARGVASRRKAEEYLAAGRVLVNGRPARVGDKAFLSDGVNRLRKVERRNSETAAELLGK